MYVESDVLYSILKESDWLKKDAERIMKKRVKISAITIVEIEIVSKRVFGKDFSNSVFDELSKIKNLKIVDLNKKILKKSVEFRKKFGLNIFDSVHAASAFELKEKIVSTDNVYDIVEGVERIDLRRFKY